MALLGLLAFALLPAGAIALVYLVVKAIVRHGGGPTPTTDSTLRDPSRFGETIALFLVVCGAISLGGIWIAGQGAGP